MKKLFIIGNGFDLAHKLHTKYCYFREFLYKQCNGKISYIPASSVDRDGDTIVDRITVAGLLMELIDNTTNGEDWADFEDAMGRYNYLSFFEEYDMDMAINDDDDDEMYRTIHNREDIVNDLSVCILEVKNLFKEWIDSININTAKLQSRFLTLFDENSEFLTFNYTKTLENVYHVDKAKVCHIHGEQGGEIVVGHGIEDNPYKEESWETFIIDGALYDLFESLKKDVVTCNNTNIDFFNGIQQAKIEEIYSIGFSFSDVDLFYISKLCELVDTKNVIWHLAKYNKKKNNFYKKLIRDCGFKGNFGKLI